MSNIKSDEEIEALLNHRNNSLPKNGVKVKIIGRGNHGNGGPEKGSHPIRRSIEDKTTIALTAEMIGTMKTAELLNVDPMVTGQLRQGNNAVCKPDPALRSAIEDKLEGVRKKVVDKVDMLLDIFDIKKISDLEGKEIPSAVDKLVATYDKVNRRNEKMPESNKPQILLWAPKQINIENYTSKEVE